MTHDELNTGIERAENWFTQIPGVTPELVEAFIEEGFLSYDDLTFLEPFVIGATCAWCLTSAILMAALLWLTTAPGSAALARVLDWRWLLRTSG